MYFSKHKGSVKRGFESEKRFVVTMEARGNKVRSASKKENKYSHIDFWVTSAKNGKRYSVDVKSSKKISRVDKYVNLDEVWIEYNNTYNGKKGWIYGEADFIAFELNKTFLVVKLKELKKLCDKLINKNIPAKSSEEALYYFWTRPEHRRKGVIERAARIKVSDIKENLKYVEYDKPLGL
jgi:hypothetical protein